MIDFRLDGPCADPRGGQSPRLRVVGIGQVGVSALDQIVLHHRGEWNLCAIDTDQQTLDGSVVRDRILLGEEVVRGLGCSGEPEVAEAIVASSVPKWSPAAKEVDYLIVVAGLGGATGAALAPEIVRQAQRSETKVVVVALLPFSFSGKRRCERACRTLAVLRDTADAVLVFGSDRLKEIPEVGPNLRHGLGHLSRLAGECVAALAQILTKCGLIQLTFADVRSLYGRYGGADVLENCWAAFGEVKAEEGALTLVEKVLATPLLGEDAWAAADHALVCVTGGSDLGLTEVQDVLAALQERLPLNFPIATGASLDPACDGRLRLTLLLASTRAPTSTTVIVAESNAALKPQAPAKAKPKTKPLPPEPAAEPVIMPLANAAPLPVIPLAHDTVPLPSVAPVLPPVPPAPKAKKPASSPAPDETQKIAVPNYYKLRQTKARQDGNGAEGGNGKAPAAAGTNPKSRKGARRASQQEELPFEAIDRGRFEKSFETIHNGENLDQPTFRRRRLEVRI